MNTPNTAPVQTLTRPAQTGHYAVPVTGLRGRLARCTFCEARWPWGSAPDSPVCLTRPWTDR